MDSELPSAENNPVLIDENAHPILVGECDYAVLIYKHQMFCPTVPEKDVR
jgi:hypothetical protein